ncbi:MULTISPECIES: phage baseplate assembly protein domain-containing protein [unclassified Moraxella]|uniref:phage baseplate assembly protein domain-containing protein n=1 Tax=unclassified Moraxella TaxID=2685852 RepID=UPI003AF60BC4
MINRVRQAICGFVKRRGTPLQVTGLSEEIIDNVRIMQQVGFASDLPVDSQVVMLPIGGRATNMVIIASGEAPIVVTANEGEVVIYDQFGHEIRLGKAGIKMIGNVDVQGNITTHGNITANGQINDMQGSMAEIRTIYNSHSHVTDGTPPTNPMV